ncbi:MAG: Sortilin, neurotensin receptor 3 [Actinomycetota bacterium]|nr:Sortilin, neurotensin receptor 3 [Actinomycetota bacterium]
MTFDQRARDAAGAVRDDLDAITIPEPTAVVRRARRRRTVRISTTAFVVAVAVVATFAFVRRSDSPTVNVSGSSTTAANGAAYVWSGDGLWSTIDKASSGIAPAASLHALTSDGTTLLLGGERAGNGGYVVTVWSSSDGVHWSESEHPTEHDSISAMATHAGTAIAIGAPGGLNAFVWRSQDHGRHWDEIARGPVFGAPIPNNRPGAFVTSLSWHAGWWIAAGGAADGYEGIWISRDGVQWQLVLDSRSSGSIDAVAETANGSLLAYGVSAVHPAGTIEIGWSTRDPSDWGRPIRIETPGLALQGVNGDATMAIGTRTDRAPETTPMLRSADGGRTWTRDTTFGSKFPFSKASAVTTAAGVSVAVGTSTEAGSPAAWFSSRSGGWVGGPDDPKDPNMQSTKGSLGLVAAVDNRIVFMESGGALDRFYTFDVAQPPMPRSPGAVASEQTVPGLARAVSRLRGVPLAYGPVAYAEIVVTTRDKVAAIFGTSPQSPTGVVEVMRVVGDFVCTECSTPPHVATPRGHEILLLIPRDSVHFPQGGGSGFSIGERVTDLSGFGTVYRMPNR